jgi:serine/threonine protein phosphatase PrpC
MKNINKKLLDIHLLTSLLPFMPSSTIKEGSYLIVVLDTIDLYSIEDKMLNSQLICKRTSPWIYGRCRIRYGEINLIKGDRILFYTDGLSESQSVLNEMYSEERIAQMLENTSSENVNKAVELIYLDMLNWVKNPSRINDDVAIVIVDFEG